MEKNYILGEKDIDLTAWQIEQLDLALVEHKNGTAKYRTWEDAKKDLFAKFNINLND
ncbi:MAG: hypothetical protein V4622_10580 [Bacteroidota bacterium]